MLAHDISPVAFLLNKIFSKNRPSITTACFANLMSDDQITGFHATGTRQYLLPSFSTWPIEGKVKWKPTTVAFSADAMS